MSTVTRELALEIIEQKGQYKTDPLVTHVIVYSNQWNGEASWAIAYSEAAKQRYFDPDSAAIDPHVVWEAGCKGCDVPFFSMHPSHSGSRNCDSGSLASGGTQTHCTCDVCF